MAMQFKAVLFDLDGTLLDTALDFGWSLNETRQRYGLRPLPYEQVRATVSDGSFAMTRLGGDIDEASPLFESFRLELLDVYANNLAVRTRLFDGMEVILSRLEQEKTPWGIVTNKPDYLTRPLLQQLELLDRADVIVSGDTLAQSKPHPAPLLHAAKCLKVEAQHCIYVGDALRDIEAGIAAGMSTILASYGYIPSDHAIAEWGADAIVADPNALYTLLSYDSND